MAHRNQQMFCEKIKNMFSEYFVNTKVLDIGSLDINGNNRYLFNNSKYIGIDRQDGENVSIVTEFLEYECPKNYFDIVISTESLQEDDNYQETISKIIDVIRPGGAFLLTCASDKRVNDNTKNKFTKDILESINNFKSNFPDGIFEYEDSFGDLYFFGIKGGIKNTKKYDLSPKVSIINSNDYKDDIFVVGCWPDTEEKENDLIECIHRLKEFEGIPILLASHYPVKPEIQKLVDFYFFDKDNPLLMVDEYPMYSISSGMWADNGQYKLESKTKFHHDYAIWVLMQKVFKICDNLGKKTIHYLEYDNIIDTFQYRQSFLEKSKMYDSVIYEYHENSSSNMNLTEYMATYIFSIKTEILLEMMNEINSKWEYFHNRPGGFQLERIFLSCLKKHTNSVYVSPYIANENELNTQAVWNRDGIQREGSAFQIYPAVDEFDNLYLCLIHGFHGYKPNDEYLLEIKYNDSSFFDTLNPREYKFIKVGKYEIGKTLKINYLGKEVFNEFLIENVDTFRNIHRIVTRDKNILESEIVSNNLKKNTINFNFVDGAFIEVVGDISKKYEVEFFDKRTNTSLYRTTIKNNTWSKPNAKFYVDWLIRVKDDTGEIQEFDFNLEGNKVLISFESFSLGDTIAWIPYADEFRKKHNCKVCVSTPHLELFKSEYSEIEFVLPGSLVNDIYAHYRLGLFVDNNNFNLSKNPIPANKVPLQKVATDILGLDYVEIKPKIKNIKPYKSEKPYICLGVHSTAQAKYWNNPTGWQELVDFAKSEGYDVYVLSKEEDGYMGNTYPNGVVHIQNKTLEEIASYLLGSDGFVGVSSGLSWYAWGLNVPTVLISGFTDEDLEMKNDVVRIINKDVCNGCWAKHMFDKGDWNWCPEHKGTKRQFECSKSITFNMVKSGLEKIFKKK
jgi:autotransporter strand-loop-strand O-heptosyltransferase